jgi:hypothetical protein
MTVPVRRARPGQMSGLDRRVATLLAMTGPRRALCAGGGVMDCRVALRASRNDGRESAENFADDAGGFDAGEALVEALGLKRELRVVQAEGVQDRRVQVEEAHGVADDVV